MKTIYKTFLLLCATAVLSGGCRDFLELSSQDLIIPKTATHYKELLHGEGYFKELFFKSSFVMYMTDDVEFLPTGNMWFMNDDYLNYYQNAYRWDAEIENEFISDDCFEYLYQQILTANTILYAIDDMEGTEQEVRVLEGQALFTRAFGHFLVAGFYGQAYNESAPGDPCVPLVMTPVPSLDPRDRNTTQEVWGQIASDISGAVERLKGAEINNIYDISYKAALVLAVRVSLFMEDYDGVIGYGEELLRLHPDLYDISGFTSGAGTGGKKFIYYPENKEIVWLFDYGNDGWGDCWNYHFNHALFPEIFAISANSDRALIPLFEYDAASETGDRRLPFWFDPPGAMQPQRSPHKYEPSDWTGMSCQNAFRTAEVYLSLAEAHARKPSPDAEKAIGYLNTLRENRIAPYTALTASDFAANVELVEFILEERRRELCMEEHHRWWDLRRSGQPSIDHLWQSGEVYRLEKNDPAYLLNYPKYEREYNPELFNPRPVRQPAN